MDIEPGYSIVTLMLDALKARPEDVHQRGHGPDDLRMLSEAAFTLLREVYIAIAERTSGHQGIVVSATNKELAAFSQPPRTGQPMTSAQIGNCVINWKGFIGEGRALNVQRDENVYTVTLYMAGKGTHSFWFTVHKTDAAGRQALVDVPQVELAPKFNIEMDRDRLVRLIIADADRKGMGQEARFFFNRLYVKWIFAGVVTLVAATVAAYTFVPPFRRFIDQRVLAPLLGRRSTPSHQPVLPHRQSGAVIDVGAPRLVVRQRSGRILHGAALDKRLYVAHGREGVRVYDIASIDNPRLIRRLPTTDARAVVLREPYLYVADGEGGLRIIDLRKPDVEAIVATVATTGSDSGIALDGNLVFVASGAAGFRIVDVHSPDHPLLTSIVRDSGITQVGLAKAVTIADHLAYVAEAPNQMFGGGLCVFDIGDPAAPRLVASMITPHGANAVLVLDSGNILIGEADGLRILTFAEGSLQSKLVSPLFRGAGNLIAIDKATVLAISASDAALLDLSVPLVPRRLPDGWGVPADALARAGISFEPRAPSAAAGFDSQRNTAR